MRVIAVLLVGLVALTTSTRAGPKAKCENNDIDDTIDVRLYQAFEKELLNNSRMLFAFKQAFYPVDQQAVHSSYNRGAELVMVILNLNIKSYYSGNSYTNFSSQYRFQWTKSTLLSTVNTVQLYTLEPMITDILYSKIVGSLNYIIIHFNFESLPCQATEDEILISIAQLLSWSKVYTNFNGAPPIWDPEDQGYVTRWYNYITKDNIFHNEKQEKESRDNSMCINYLFLLLNIIIPCITFKVGTNKKVAQFLSHLINRHDIRKVYCSTTIVLSIIYVVYVSAAIILHITDTDNFPGSVRCTLCGIPHNTVVFKNEVEAFIIKMTIVPLAMFAQLMVAIRISRNILKSSHTKCCINCFHATAMWMILMFVQLIAGSMLIPTCLFLIIDPINTFNIIATHVLIIVVLITLLTQLLSHQVRPGERAFSCMNISRFILRLTWFIVSFLCIGLIVIVYLSVNEKLHEGPLAIGRIVLTLLPSIVLSVIIWLIKKRFHKRWHLKEIDSYQPYQELE